VSQTSQNDAQLRKSGWAALVRFCGSQNLKLARKLPGLSKIAQRYLGFHARGNNGYKWPDESNRSKCALDLVRLADLLCRVFGASC